MIELSLIRDLVAIFGVIAGLTFYIWTVRNANIARRTEQAIRLLDKNQDVENNRIWTEVYSMEWSDYDDFMRKYHLSVNPDNWAKRMRIFGNYNEMGYQLYHNLVDIETVNSLMGEVGAIHIWNKFGSIIVAQRERNNDKDYCRWLEYAAKEMGKEMAKRGVKPDFTDVIEYTA